ncbi:hypothetical protein BC835DRAFT_400825 [Cytidiella melzeri]|nr:hypothetical protein BC835DRAFT_400825 [Cytidiella melzeri]
MNTSSCWQCTPIVLVWLYSVTPPICCALSCLRARQSQRTIKPNLMIQGSSARAVPAATDERRDHRTSSLK